MAIRKLGKTNVNANKYFQKLDKIHKYYTRDLIGPAGLSVKKRTLDNFPSLKWNLIILCYVSKLCINIENAIIVGGLSISLVSFIYIYIYPLCY